MNFVFRIKNLLKKPPPKPKEPRKKIELQLKTMLTKFNDNLTTLETCLERQNLLESTRKVGKQILLYANRFQELQFVRINQARLQTLSSPLIAPGDFSLWVVWEMKNITEEMYHFCSSIQ